RQNPLFCRPEPCPRAVVRIERLVIQLACDARSGVVQRRIGQMLPRHLNTLPAELVVVRCPDAWKPVSGNGVSPDMAPVSRHLNPLRCMVTITDASNCSRDVRLTYSVTPRLQNRLCRSITFYSHRWDLSITRDVTTGHH